jgi:DNA replication protein DnaC
VIENLLRNDLILVDEVGFAPLDDNGAQLLFRFVSAAYERRALGLASHWPVVTAGDSFRMRQARARGGTNLTRK